MKSISLFILGAAALTEAANQVVMVGKGGTVYVPNTVTAAVGDTVEFQFVSAVY
jgi:plastocyanin